MARQRKTFLIGDLVKDKTNGAIGIIEHSYKDAFGHGSHSEFSILWLDDDGKPDFSHAWNYKKNLEVIDTEHRQENIKKIRKYNRGDAAPICMDSQLAKKLGYKGVHTYESAMAESRKLSKKQIVIEV